MYREPAMPKSVRPRSSCHPKLPRSTLRTLAPVTESANLVSDMLLIARLSRNLERFVERRCIEERVKRRPNPCRLFAY